MKTMLVLMSVALTLGACANARDTRMAEGAAIGATGGAIIGGVASNNIGGALVGGVVGAGVGAVVADATRPRHGHKSCYYSEALGHRVCHYVD